MPAEPSESLALLGATAARLVEEITHATTISGLRRAAHAIDEWLPVLHQSGLAIRLISALICELNDRLMARLWTLLAPEDLVANSCLFVMGSEGRGEQTLKTDQDNGLLLRDGFVCDGLSEVADSFNRELLQFGYPLCPGGIMLCNPQWRQSQTGFRQTIRHWGSDADAAGLLNLAILLDARAIAGDSRLLGELSTDLWSLVPDSDALLARFTRPIAQFDQTGVGWLQRLVPWPDSHHQHIDLKKSGSFQIVHGVRSLAFKHRVAAASTRERLQQLVGHHGFPAALAAELTDAMDLLNEWRLTLQLRQRRLGRPVDNLIACNEFGTLDRARLDGILGVVRHLREYLRLHCPFEMI